jgi:NADH:ubiquinone oxidoreductase subunit 6 (subunit J)
LAILSLLVIGTWLVLTEMLFIYIVYVLAFVGAIIMLFLSVVLMLPASVTASPIQNNSLLCIVVYTELNSNPFLFDILIFFTVTACINYIYYIVLQLEVFDILKHTIYPILAKNGIEQSMAIMLP